jgi:hypothetical protein
MPQTIPTTEIPNGPMVTDMLLKQLIEEQRVQIAVLIEIRGTLGIP